LFGPASASLCQIREGKGRIEGNTGEGGKRSGMRKKAKKRNGMEGDGPRLLDFGCGYVY